MARKRSNIQFPFGGLNKHGAYRQQPPYTTMDCVNVRPRATISGRARGGSRPGIVQTHIEDLGGEIRFLEPMVLLPNDSFHAFSDTFSGTVMADYWTAVAGSTLPNILQSSLAGIDSSVADAASVLDLDPITNLDTSSDYTVELYIVPWNGAHHGKYSIYMRMDNTTPVPTTDGVVVELDLGGDGAGSVTDGTWTGTITSYSSGVPTENTMTGGSDGQAEPGWLIASVSGDDVTVWWNGTKIEDARTVDSHTGKRVGFALECTESNGLCLAWVFRVQFYGSTNTLRSKLIASADGSIYQEELYGRMTVVATDLSVRSDVSLGTAQSGQKLYIADYGLRVNGDDGTVSGSDLDADSVADWTGHSISADDDVVVVSNVGGATVAGTYKISSIASGALTLESAPGDGTCSFRVERAPKIYDPVEDTLTIMTATAGQVPSGNPLIMRYLDRIFLGGGEIAPHAYYASRVGDPLDFDYTQEDSRTAVAGPVSDAGVPGDPLTALVAHNDDYAIFACRNSIWRMRGDPAFGSAMSALSRTIGIIGPKSWCLGPEGELVFLSLDGIYVLAPSGESVPIQISREFLPEEFLNINPDVMTALLEYDVHAGGVNIYLTSDTTNSRKHFWLDWNTKTFWPFTIPTDYEPTATCLLQGIAVEDDGVILGGRDGKLRRFTDLAETDAGTSFASYVMIGPIALAGDMLEGSILVMSASMAVGSGDVTWSLHPSRTFEGTLTAASQDTGTWSAGISDTSYPSCRGQAYVLKIAGSSGRKWALETITVVSTTRGRGRRG